MKDGSAAPAGTRDLARALVEGACAAGLTVATAESCTAGMVASLIADVPGASEVLRGGAVTYCDEIKHRVLGVSSETLERYTAVSPQTAREMALGARSLFSTDMAVSLTGYAGPAGSSAEFDIMYGTGISKEGSILDMGVDFDIVNKSGAWYTYEQERLGQGREAAKEFLRKNPALSEEIEHRVRVASGLDFEDEPVGEALEIADVPEGDTMRETGARA